ncbi:MAG TPA: WD40 repeat domain-containing protein [Candidatus Babeliales bacterium]|nr:WD40 repeat domain-containing protein [Candidatus Babeliales bacterium]
MKYYLYPLILIPCLLIESLFYCMESSIIYTPIIKQITSIEHPRQSICLSDYTALVLHKNGCSIIDITQDKEIKKICPHPNIDRASEIVLHPDKTKMAFFYQTKSLQSEIAIYNLETGKKEWSKNCGYKEINNAAFSPLDNIIGLSNIDNTKIHIYNYKTSKEPTVFDIKNKYDNKEDCHDIYMAFQTTNPQELYLGRNCLYLLNLPTGQFNQISRAYGRRYAFNTQAKLVAKYSDKSVYIFNPQKGLDKIKINFLTNIPDNYIKEIVFHPNNAVLVIADSKDCVSFWDIATQKMICQTNPLPWDTEFYTFSYLSCTPNGKKLILTDYNYHKADYGKCISIPIPFKVVYKDITEQQCHFLYFILKEYEYTYNIPNGVTIFLMELILKIHERKA